MTTPETLQVLPDLLQAADYRWAANVHIRNRWQRDGSIRDLGERGIAVNPGEGPEGSSFRASLPPTRLLHRPERRIGLLSPAEQGFLDQLAAAVETLNALQRKGTSDKQGRLKEFKSGLGYQKSSFEAAIEYLPTLGTHLIAAQNLGDDLGMRSADFSDSWSIQLLGLQWPQNPDSVLALGAMAIGNRLDKNAVHDAPDHAFLLPLFDPARPWSEMAHLLACLALTAKDSDQRTTAVDAAIEALADGRADPKQMAAVFARLAEADFLRANRLAGVPHHSGGQRPAPEAADDLASAGALRPHDNASESRAPPASVALGPVERNRLSSR